MVRVCMDEVRAVSYALHPPAIDMLGLAPALEWQAKRLRRAERSLQDSFGHPGTDTDRTDADRRDSAVPGVSGVPLPMCGATQKTDTAHARLSYGRAWTSFWRSRTAAWEYRPTCFDNPGRKGCGIGLLKMRERLAELGGTLEIISNQPGTTVRARVPHGRRAESATSERDSERDAGSARRKSAQR